MRLPTVTTERLSQLWGRLLGKSTMKAVATLIIGPILATLVIVGMLLENPALGEAYFGGFWWAGTMIVMVLSIGLILIGMGGESEGHDAGRAHP